MPEYWEFHRDAFDRPYIDLDLIKFDLEDEAIIIDLIRRHEIGYVTAVHVKNGIYAVMTRVKSTTYGALLVYEDRPRLPGSPLVRMIVGLHVFAAPGPDREVPRSALRKAASRLRSKRRPRN